GPAASELSVRNPAFAIRNIVSGNADRLQQHGGIGVNPVQVHSLNHIVGDNQVANVAGDQHPVSFPALKTIAIHLKRRSFHADEWEKDNQSGLVCLSGRPIDHVSLDDAELANQFKSRPRALDRVIQKYPLTATEMDSNSRYVECI